MTRAEIRCAARKIAKLRIDAYKSAVVVVRELE